MVSFSFDEIVKNSGRTVYPIPSLRKLGESKNDVNFA